MGGEKRMSLHVPWLMPSPAAISSDAAKRRISDASSGVNAKLTSSVSARINLEIRQLAGFHQLAYDDLPLALSSLHLSIGTYLSATSFLAWHISAYTRSQVDSHDEQGHTLEHFNLSLVSSALVQVCKSDIGSTFCTLHN